MTDRCRITFKRWFTLQTPLAWNKIKLEKLALTKLDADLPPEAMARLALSVTRPISAQASALDA